MTRPTGTSWPPTLDELVETARTRPGLSDEGKARMLSAVLVSIGPRGPQGGGEGSSSGSGSTTTPGSASSAGSALVGRGLLALASFALGAGSVALYTGLRPVETRVVVVHARAPSDGAPTDRQPRAAVREEARAEPPAPTLAPLPSPRASSSRATSAASEVPSSRRANDGRGDEELSVERSLVDRARAALVRGRHAAALEALGEHAARFPRGRLAEERDALRVHALATAGRRDEARAAARRFGETHPDSLLLPGLSTAVGDRSDAAAEDEWWRPAVEPSR